LISVDANNNYGQLPDKKKINTHTWFWQISKALFMAFGTAKKSNLGDVLVIILLKKCLGDDMRLTKPTASKIVGAK
jgi:hypothetical protein